MEAMPFFFGVSMFDLKNTVIGIELGSTRIKSVLVDSQFKPVASGSFSWENQLIDGIWTYSMEDAIRGLQSCFASLKKDVYEKYGIALTTTGGLGISGMMHGYLTFDKEDRQLAAFRTWRNTITEQSAEILSEAFQFNVPQRWSIAHLYQAILNGEEHVASLSWMTTLAGYIHYLLSGQKVMGVGEASGMFPIDSVTHDYDAKMLQSFQKLIGNQYSWKIKEVLPKVLVAGEDAGRLTEEGARLLDPTGDFAPGVVMCPPEGDAGTGMVATNSVRLHIGNVSAGTSDFAMVVTGKKLGVHREIDMVTTPSGIDVAMVHCNNCTSDINAWANVFLQFGKRFKPDLALGDVFTAMFEAAKVGVPGSTGLMNFNYLSGEGITNLNEGIPLFARRPDADFSFENFMRVLLESSLVTLKLGLKILDEEKVVIEKLYGHGGFFKTPEVGQRILSAASHTPVSVMTTAGEGGPYGMALLAAFCVWKTINEGLEDFLDQKVYANAEAFELMATKEEIEGFSAFAERFEKALPLEKEAIASIGN